MSSQKKDKSAGPNGIYTESYLFADIKLHVHLSLFFIFCLRHCYLPSACMDSVILPVVMMLTTIELLPFQMLRLRF